MRQQASRSPVATCRGWKMNTRRHMVLFEYFTQTSCEFFLLDAPKHFASMSSSPPTWPFFWGGRALPAPPLFFPLIYIELLWKFFARHMGQIMYNMPCYRGPGIVETPYNLHRIFVVRDGKKSLDTLPQINIIGSARGAGIRGVWLQYRNIFIFDILQFLNVILCRFPLVLASWPYEHHSPFIIIVNMILLLEIIANPCVQTGRSTMAEWANSAMQVHIFSHHCRLFISCFLIFRRNCNILK